MKKGAILINLGTPDSPEPNDVKKYLDEFLMDPYVVDIPWVFRWMLVKGIILRTRPKQSSEAYHKIWGAGDSPLRIHLNDLTSQVKAHLGSEYEVAAGMRYGKPSIASAVEQLKSAQVSKIVAIPLYPQYSLAASESSIELLKKELRQSMPQAELKLISEFYAEEWFLEPFRQIIQSHLSQTQWDHLLFSFHGLPERQVKKADPSKDYCLRSFDCCRELVVSNRHCYRAQCFATARMLAAKLGLRSEQYSVGFQSRLGRTPWIEPHTDVLYQQLAQKGIKRLAIACPAFVSDCLETLEEIAIRGKEQFKSFGGEDLTLIASLNGSESWTRAVAQTIKSSFDF